MKIMFSVKTIDRLVNFIIISALVVIIAALITGCKVEFPVKDPLALPEEIKECKIVKLKYQGEKLTVVKCPGAVTSSTNFIDRNGEKRTNVVVQPS
jgi:hypothetical protein